MLQPGIWSNTNRRTKKSTLKVESLSCGSNEDIMTNGFMTKNANGETSWDKGAQNKLILPFCLWSRNEMPKPWLLRLYFPLFCHLSERSDVASTISCHEGMDGKVMQEYKFTETVFNIYSSYLLALVRPGDSKSFFLK